MIDIIFISRGDNASNIAMTQNAIDTAINTTKLKVNCVVVEQIPNVEYKHAKTLNYNFKFNYNKCLNYGVSKTKNKYILLANNDLIFYDNWAEELVKYNVLSSSPYSENNPHTNISNKGVYKGYKVGKTIMGWAIFVKREIFDIIGKLDETYTFWSSDNVYCEQLKKHNIEHYFITSSRVDHLCSQTLKQQTNKKEITTIQKAKFDNDLKYNIEFSVIMPSYLGSYPRAAANRKDKFIRAVKSLQKQSFTNWELLIVADGCDETVQLYKKHFAKDKRIKCFKIPKQPLWSGKVRYAGQSQSKGKYICYLDSDDYLKPNHLQFIKNNISSYDWGYMSEYAYNNKGVLKKEVKLQVGSSGTSTIVHRSSLKANWRDLKGHCHDWELIKLLKKESDNYSHIGQGGYVVCHSQNSFDN